MRESKKELKELKAMEVVEEETVFNAAEDMVE